MSTWDEKAEDYAVAHHTYEYLTPDENAYYTSGFVRGARWQREALLSDESVERAARDLYEMAPYPIFGERINPKGFTPWSDVDDQWRYRDMARAALTAAIGDDDE